MSETIFENDNAFAQRETPSCFYVQRRWGIRWYNVDYI